MKARGANDKFQPILYTMDSFILYYVHMDAAVLLSVFICICRLFPIIIIYLGVRYCKIYIAFHRFSHLSPTLEIQ